MSLLLQPNDFKTKFNAKRLVADLMFKRHHPIYDEWKEWSVIVHYYHSPQLTTLLKTINHGNVRPGFTSFVGGCDFDLTIEIIQLKNSFDWEFRQKDLMDLTPGCEIYHEENLHNCTCKGNLVQKHCPQFYLHLRAFYLAYMFSMREREKSKKIKKYYSRLARVVCSLSEERLKQFPTDLIMEPREYANHKSSLLRFVYERGFCDLASTDEIARKLEYLKHFRIPNNINDIVMEQGAVPQCHNGLQMQEITTKALELIEKIGFDQLINQLLIPQEQGLFTINHRIDTQDLQQLKEMVNETKQSFTDSFGTMLLSSGQSLMCMFAVASTISVLAQGLAGAAVKATLNVLHVLYSLIFGSGSEEQIRRSIACEQSGDNNISIPFLPAMVLDKLLGVPSTILNTLWKNPNIDMTMRRLGFLGDPRIDRGIERLILWVTKVMRMTRAWYCREVLGLSVPEDLESDSHPFLKWKDEVDEIVRQYYDNSFVWSETSWSVVYNLYSRGFTFTRSRLYERWHREIFQVIQKLGNILEKFKQHSKDGQSIRNPPVTIYLSGGTGVGKTSITYPLAVEILKAIHDREGGTIDLKKNWKNLIYMRSPEQEFWDGYENQLVTVFDDFCQQADSVSNANLELFEIVRSSNCFPYPLHMASLEQKATTSFTSKVIIVSSNLEKPRTQSLNFPDALYRRFDLCVRVKRKAEFSGDLIEFNPNIYDLGLYQMTTGRFIRSITYKELIGMCVDEYFKRSSFVSSVESYIEKVLESPQAQEQGPGPTLPRYFQEDDVEDKWIWEDDPVLETLTPKQLEQVISRTEDGVVVWEENFRTMTPWDKVKWPFVKAKELWNQQLVKVPDPFQALETANQFLSRKATEIKIQWSKFKENHPYVFKSLIIVSVILTALGFLKMFLSISKIAKKTDTTPTITKLWRGGEIERVPRAQLESYQPTAAKRATVEAYAPKAQPRAKIEAYTPTKVSSVKVEGALEEGVKDLNATEVLSSLVRRNLYKMYESTQNTPIGHCIFLKGKIALMPKHFMRGIRQAYKNDQDSVIYFRSALLARSFEMKSGDMLKGSHVKFYESPSEENGPVVTRDLMAIWVDSSIVHSDMTGAFCSRGSLSGLVWTQMMIPVVVENNMKGSDAKVLLLRFREGRSAVTTVKQLSVGNSIEDCARFVRDAWRYEADTQVTECGAPLIVRNSKVSSGKICGIHIAGIDGTGEGFSTPVYKEDVVEIFKLFDAFPIVTLKQEKVFQPYVVEQGQIPDEAEFVRVGQLERPVFQHARTMIEPSLCYAKIQQPVTKPCQLRPTKEFDPRRYRLQRLGNFPQAIQREVAEIAGAAFASEVLNVLWNREDQIPNSVKSVYSFEEAIVGIEGDQFVNSIKRTTSPGFPYVHDARTQTRKKFFGVEDEYDLSTPQVIELKERVMYIIDQAKQGIALDHYFVDTLKDERKPIHKAHKTRLFSAGPLDYLIACKMYFNGPVALLQRSRNWSHVSVGTNPYSEDWEEIARILLRKSQCMVAGDFEGFDASQHVMLLEQSGEVLIAISEHVLDASEETVMVMRTLLVSLLNSFHITGKEVYQWTHSLPSGHYLTAPINSIFVNIAFCCAWMEALGRLDRITAASFWEECGIVAYGDDHVISIPPHRIEVFNQFSIPEFFKTIGLSYTMEDKDAIVTRPYRSLQEISYLKRGFSRDEDGRWLAPLAIGTILETPMWMHSNPDPKAQTLENLDWALKELSLHSETVWKEWAPVLWREQKRLGHSTKYVNQFDTRMVCVAQSFEM